MQILKIYKARATSFGNSILITYKINERQMYIPLKGLPPFVHRFEGSLNNKLAPGRVVVV